MFTTHTIESAPEQSRPLLRDLEASAGMIPNLAAAMSESPPLLRGFLTLRDVYQGGSFTPAEIQVLSLTAAYENDCAWCMAFHTRMAELAGVISEDITELRAGRPPVTSGLRALSEFARGMLTNRGAVPADHLERFLEVGYTRAQALEVVLGMAFSLMANYAGHLARPVLDPPLEAHRWSRPVPGEQSSLYERLGGYDGIVAFIGRVFPRVASHPSLAHYFRGHGMESQELQFQRLVELICAAAGGPAIYTGRPMKPVHAGLGITSREWDVFIELISQGLDEASYPEHLRSEFLAVWEGYRDVVVD